MHDGKVNHEPNVTPINEGENSELEPVALAKVSEVTSHSEGGRGDPLDNIVWGTEN
jgi:hypothetical protein